MKLSKYIILVLIVLAFVEFFGHLIWKQNEGLIGGISLTAILILAIFIRKYIKANDHLIETDTKYQKLIQHHEWSRKQLHSLFHYNPDIIFFLDKDGNFINANPTVEQLTGFNWNDLIDTNFLQTVPRKERNFANEKFYSALKGNRETFKMSIFNSKGEQMEFNVTAVPLIVDENIVGVTGIARDITQRQKMESLLIESEQRYKSLFVHNTDAVLSFDLEGRFTSVNPESEMCSGYSEEELLSMSFQDLLIPEDIERVVEFFEQVKAGNPLEYETAMYNKKGERLDLSVKNMPIYTNGQIVGVFSIIKDVTENNKAQLLLDGQTKVLEMIAKGALITKVFDEIIYMIEKLSNGGRCSILLADESKSRLHIGSAPNLPKGYMEALNGISIGPRAGSCGSSAHYKKMVIVEDISKDALWTRYRDIPQKYQLVSCWSSPILDNQDMVLGTFAIYFNQPALPTEAELKLIEKATYLAKLAILHYKAEDTINHMAYHDPLTGLPNRRLFKKRFEHTLEEIAGKRIEASLLFLDLDRFKVINDSLGHSIGDLLLQKVANRLKYSLRRKDFIGRQGGDEFLILLEESTKEETEFVAKRILKALSRPFRLKGHEVVITPSIGISLFPTHGHDPETLIRNADIAMYDAKRQGKNTYQFYQLTQEKVLNDQLVLEQNLRKSLERDEFVLHYQPQVDLVTNQICGVEALIRWNHPELGSIPPNRFIPVAEETGLIVPIGEWVIKTACEQNVIWQNNGWPSLVISVNLSIRQFFQANLISMVCRILEETGLDPQYLELEITESMTMNVEMAIGIIQELKQLGVKVAIDDFGTGYSSLNYLKRLTIDRLKIDQSFVQDIAKDSNDRDIVTTIITMGHNLKMKVIAEGVETEEQLQFLRTHGCDEVQGYLFSKPLSAEDFVEKFGKVTEKI
ncbi:EAL domain-containing protein [Neobacillus sp. D3-1R]|uniref:EAL domain-containing protein n=1 Tax=Neobacillus sp. D3-1R TaxID=3445778 RepID=UPI003FA17D1F